MAEHYGTAIIPARVRAPKDKPNAEGAVGNISTWIIAALRKDSSIIFKYIIFIAIEDDIYRDFFTGSFLLARVTCEKVVQSI